MPNCAASSARTVRLPTSIPSRAIITPTIAHERRRHWFIRTPITLPPCQYLDLSSRFLKGSIANARLLSRKHGRLLDHHDYGPETIVTVIVALYDPAAASAGTTNCVVNVSVLFPIPFAAAELKIFAAVVGIASGY